MNQDLSFDGNPGAVRYGNFINYYQFHPPESRINNLPKNLWNFENTEHSAVLDMGCNAGDLTVALHKFLSDNSNCKKISTLGIDIDPTLITRCKEIQHDDISFECVNIMSKDSEDSITCYLEHIGKNNFDVIFCFSITMWIHLNYGDDGLYKFLDIVCKRGNFLVIEPQPWKCYRSAVKRMNKSSNAFPLYSKLTMRSNVESEIENIIIKNGFTKIHETQAEWDRKILFFTKNK